MQDFACKITKKYKPEYVCQIPGLVAQEYHMYLKVNSWI